MKRYLDDRVTIDLAQKMVILTGPRQVGKTSLARQLMQSQPGSQYLNWDIPNDRAILQKQSWNPRAPLLVFDEIHKMPGWKNWLKGVADSRAKLSFNLTSSTAPHPAADLAPSSVPNTPPSSATTQQVLVTGSARMDTFRQAGESLAGRYFALRLHPISVREACEHAAPALSSHLPSDTLTPAHTSLTPHAALDRLLERGGFPEPFLAADANAAERWRAQYFTDLVREDVLEFSRVQEIKVMRLFVEMLRERVGSPLSLASLARDLAVSPATLKRYLDILQALFIVFVVNPWHHNIGRALLQAPKVYFFDTGVVRGDAGVRFENAVAAMLLKQVHYQQDALGQAAQLHYVRTKDGAEVDFALSLNQQLTHLIEAKLADAKPHRALQRFAAQFPEAQAVQLVAQLHQEEWLTGANYTLQIADAAPWLANLAA